MIKCKNCEYRCDYTGKPCPICGAAMTIDKADIEEAARELSVAIKEKNPAKIHSCRHLLADGGDVESMREYAKLIERGDYQVRDIDTAMNYFYRAAKKYDSYSAYRFSRLVSRSNEEHAKFWLRFSALLGSIDSYPEAAELFSSENKEEIASYYYSLAAACDDTLSIVTMAKRWYEGIGVPKCDAHAKWYLDKLSIPPISAIKLSYKLRSAVGREPSKLSFPEYYKYIRLLSENAKRLGFDSAYFYLVAMLAKQGDINAECAVGVLMFEGKGCEQNIEKAKTLLDININHKNPSAAVYLAEAYLNGTHVEKNHELAMKYFAKASELGYPEAYEKLGDIYRCREDAEKDVAKAIEFYELAAAGGCSSAKVKADELKEQRKQFFLEAYQIINLKEKVTSSEAFSAFRSAAIATAMGEMRAATLLAKCYAHGFGTDKDRSSAFFWYKHAAENGEKDAYLPLGLCYSRGFGTEFSYNEAMKYLKFAANLGAGGASAEIDRLYKRKTNKMVRALYANAVELIYMKKFNEAANLLLSFESIAYPKALYTLGCLYEFGRGVPKSSRSKAEKYYELAFVGNSMFGSFKDPNSRYKLKILKMMR